MRRLRGLGPAMARPGLREGSMAALGAAVCLALAAVVLGLTAGPASDALHHPLLLAPFGASAFLIAVVPSSPLAQPWSVVTGNLVSALAALGATALGLPTLVTVCLGVSVAVLAMAAARALHPPGGALALLVALTAPPDWWHFLAGPILTGSLALVAAGVLWARIAGRVYPFRQPTATGAHATQDRPPDRRLLPPPEALADLLSRLRLEANIGVEDLTRLMAAAGVEANLALSHQLTAGHLMSRDLVTVPPDCPLPVLADLFHRHRFKTLPVVGADRHLLGLVEETTLTGRSDPALTARDLLSPPVMTAQPDTRAAELVGLLIGGVQQSVPVLAGERLVGLVTRSDLLALLAHSLPAQSGD